MALNAPQGKEEGLSGKHNMKVRERERLGFKLPAEVEALVKEYAQPINQHAMSAKELELRLQLEKQIEELTHFEIYQMVRFQTLRSFCHPSRRAQHSHPLLLNPFCRKKTEIWQLSTCPCSNC